MTPDNIVEVTIHYDRGAIVRGVEYGHGYVVKAPGFKPARGSTVANAVAYFLRNNDEEGTWEADRAHGQNYWLNGDE